MFCTLGPVRVLLVTHGYPPRYNTGSCVGGRLRGSRVRAARRPVRTRVWSRGHNGNGGCRVRLRAVNNPESRDRFATHHDVVHVNHDLLLAQLKFADREGAQTLNLVTPERNEG